MVRIPLVQAMTRALHHADNTFGDPDATIRAALLREGYLVTELAPLPVAQQWPHHAEAARAKMETTR